MRGFALSSLVAVSLCAAPAWSQYGRGPWEQQEPARVSVEELASTGAIHNERMVMVQGALRYGDLEDQNVNIFELRGKEGTRTVRVGASAASTTDIRFMVGRDVAITGIFFNLRSVFNPQYHPVLRYFPGVIRTDTLGMDKDSFIAITAIDVMGQVDMDLGPDTTGENTDIVDPDIQVGDVLQVDIRNLVAQPEQYDGKQIAVLGKFRGNNLYGDLSIRDKRTPRDFVIKAADAAIWVTGRRPRGDGFRLDPKKRRDTGKWLTVIGQPWLHEDSGIYYLRAEKIELADKPDREELEPVKVVSEEEETLGPPPEVTFSLPLAGERDIPLDSEFNVQFSNDMNRESFNRNVDLLYDDDDGIGNPFPELEVEYIVDTRTLMVRPNKELERGKQIRLILYDAIEDEDGQRITPEPGAEEIEPGAAVVLTFTTAR